MRYLGFLDSFGIVAIVNLNRCPLFGYLDPSGFYSALELQPVHCNPDRQQIDDTRKITTSDPLSRVLMLLRPVSA